jgi:hypothetical protein
MKKFESEEVIEEKRILVEWTCDLCQVDMMAEKFHPHLEGESMRGWEQTNDMMRVIESPREDEAAMMDIDLCGNCWDNKLVPWLRENGFDAKYEKSWELSEEEIEHEENCEDCKEERKKSIN